MDRKCVADLYCTDPRDDKTRIEGTKGSLLKDSYCWILSHVEFAKWRDDRNSRLLWIKGDPGKGKTMLLCGIIDELSPTTKLSDEKTTKLLSYFFCQATDGRINNATAILRGLIYLLVQQQPALVSYIQKRYEDAGKQLFEGPNAWVALSQIFTAMLADPNLPDTYLIIDALDECVEDLGLFLSLLVGHSTTTNSAIKWILSSRNWPDIEEQLNTGTRLCLELNEQCVSAAVDLYIQNRVDRLARRKNYDVKTRDGVLHHLLSNAHGTFLWVALVSQNLEKIQRGRVLARIAAFPPGLDTLYQRMMDQIHGLDDADLCKQILAVVSTVYRPITVMELAALIGAMKDLAEDIGALREIIALCGSFLTVREDTVYFVHQSAKDFLLEKALLQISSSTIEDLHRAIFLRSLQAMSKALRRDIYHLVAPGFPIDQLPAHLAQRKEPDPLATIRYSCIYWVDHLYDSGFAANGKYALPDSDLINRFLRRSYLHWLEALSLLKSMSHGVLSMIKLESLAQVVYVSTLIFSPTNSIVRTSFQEEAPLWITTKPGMEGQWNACIQTLEGHISAIVSIAFAPNSHSLASGSFDGTIKIWDPASGACMQTLEDHTGYIASIAFTPDGRSLAIGSSDRTIKIWDLSGACIQTLEGHTGFIASIAFAPDGRSLAIGSSDRTIKIWDLSGACIQTLEGHTSVITSIAFAPDSHSLASGSFDRTIKIWDLSGDCLWTLMIGRQPYCLKFDPTRSHLITDFGIIDLNLRFDCPPITNSPLLPTLQHSRYRGYGISLDRTWIVREAEKVLWLPPDYRPSSSAVTGSLVALACNSGRVLILGFSTTGPSLQRYEI
ncbi:hypothetical protein GQ53DRAFT_666471 [Thozetella sp. PMI_491]|nr:hypothetical protein GQ53DRAFT_666471 [Thozetella sp. PMI_491]